MWNNGVLLAAFAVGSGLLTAVLLLEPLQALFHVTALTGARLGTVAALSVGSMVAVQLLKTIYRKNV